MFYFVAWMHRFVKDVSRKSNSGRKVMLTYYVVEATPCVEP